MKLSRVISIHMVSITITTHADTSSVYRYIQTKSISNLNNFPLTTLC